MIDWEEITLGDAAEILSAKRVFARDYVDNGVPFWRGKEVVELSAGRDVSTELFISEETYQNLGKKAGFPSAGDILLTSVGTLGRVYRLTTKDRIYFKDGNLTWFRKFNERICPQWLLYWLRSNAGQRALDSSKIGSTQQALTIVNLKKIPFLCPPKAEQEKIAATLSALDDKIELNRRMNETLEEMARALFRDWFVDFGPTRRQMEGATDPAAIMGQAFPPEKATTLARLFPAKLEDDGLPEGWSNGEVSDLADLNPKSWSAKNHPQSVKYVDLSNTKWGRIEEVTPYEWSEAPSRARRILEVGDSIVGTVRPGNGSYSLIGRAGLTGSTGFAVIRPKNSKAIEFVYCALTSPENIEKLANLADGGAYPAINPKVVAATAIARTGTDLIEAFSNVTQCMFSKRHANDQEIQTLAEMRDLLLPKLMSGEIRLKDVEAVS
mmetsp:Transcript_23662/g.42113  ORF Transcript_23662/g.42113 Transcript_23662/m.42113 type:complete len:439 (+) Transcript_23662:246-1562(+)